MHKDRMKITILADGTIKTTSDEISPANHQNAEEFLAMMARLAGGETVREARTDVEHQHQHDHVHDEDIEHY